MQHLIQLELNEVNFEYVKHYAAEGKLPVLSQLMSNHGLTETTSEDEYSDLEPWIQWVSAHTGLNRAEHSVFRLGDICEHDHLEQIWERLERKGISVGAVSPMNAENRCSEPAFFLPDPWTKSALTAPPVLKRLHRAIAQMVNDNAQSRVEASSIANLLIGMIYYGSATNYTEYIRLVARAPQKPWSKALLLDLLLSDVFCAQLRRTNAQFATLFLNAAAHIQHHYLFNSSSYRGPNENPSWYISASGDPVLEVFQLYDRLVGRVLACFPSHRVIIATGLRQVPYPDVLYYWRLKDHENFLRKIGIPFASVEPRMSRDFVVFVSGPAEALQAQALLEDCVADDGIRLFDVDNRGTSLFVMLVYPRQISSELGFSVAGRHFTSLSDDTAFVAIKNGEHHGTGYLIDNGIEAREAPKSRALTELAGLAERHFLMRYD